MKHLGDITKINGAEIAPVDVIIGGSPCQDLSIAGKRAGLAGARSGLFMEQIRIVKEMRNATNGTRPRFMVWENVPGAFSSNKGSDFAAVIEETIRVIEPEAPRVDVPERGWPTWGQYRDVGGRWSVAWRVLDAQYWGVPQRRRRIALVADFGGNAAGEILFNRKGVSRDTEPRSETREGAAAGTESGVNPPIARSLTARYDGSPCVDRGPEIVWCLQGNGIDRADTAGCNGRGWRENQSYTLNTVDRPAVACLTPWDPQNERIYDEDGVFHTLNAGEKAGQSRDGVFCAGFKLGNSECARSIGYSEECAPTLNAESGGNKPAVCEIMPFDITQITSPQNGSVPKFGNPCHTLNANAHAPSIVYAFDSMSSNSMKSPNPHSGCRKTDIAKTLDTSDTRPDKNQGGIAILDMSHANDVIRDCGETIPTLTSRMGTGGNQVPLTMRYRSFGDYEQSEQASTLKARNTPDNSDVVCETRTFTNQSYGEYRESDIAGTCAQRDYKSARDLALGRFVRRLTPLECERLQGLPDGWTNIGDWTDSKGRTRKTSDAARYKAIGNSIALPPWKWVLKRLCAEYERDATMGSLFDGIGGFPLIWEQINGKGNCLWASEIEEFCIAVTKRRFNHE